MRKIKIVTDSCSDLGKDIRDQYEIDYVRMKTVCDGEEKDADLNWSLYSPKELYDIMRGGKRVTTTQVPLEEFTRAFTEYAKEGYDVVYIGCALRLSSSVNTGTLVAKKVMEEYPDCKIFCIDALNSSLGEGSLAIKAAQFRDEGLSAEEIKDKILPLRTRVNQFCVVNNLDCLKKAGRVKASAAFFGNLFGVKPVIVSDAQGNNIAVKKVKGRAASLNEIVASLKEVMTDPHNETVYLVHADCIDDANKVKEMIMKEIQPKDVYMSVMGPIIGASCGPDTIAVFGFGKEVTLNKE